MKINICVIGCGNITNTRHIPALKKNKDIRLVGLISDLESKLNSTILKHKELSSLDKAVIDLEKDFMEQLSATQWFMNNVDAVIIGTPPKQHYPLVKACLLLDKHVLVEKPMMMNIAECDEVMEIASDKGLILNVMHSFQFANGMLKLKKKYEAGEFGKANSILELQLSNRERRLPLWYNDLPLGLFFDEAAHFFYSARKFGGNLQVKNVSAYFNERDNTPRFLQAQMMSGELPVQMYMNFNSPVCEWGIALICEEKIAIYDYFKDILIVLKNDKLHLAKNVFYNSLSFFYQYWKGFISNGFRMITGNLMYGHDLCIKSFIKAIETGKSDYELSAELGREVVKAMNEVVFYAKGE